MVYKLTINDSTSFAVKKLRKETAEHDRGFERELEAMGDIKHHNIITLYGHNAKWKLGRHSWYEFLQF